MRPRTYGANTARPSTSPAGKSFAFQPKTERARRAAKRVINDRLDEVLEWA